LTAKVGILFLEREWSGYRRKGVNGKDRGRVRKIAK